MSAAVGQWRATYTAGEWIVLAGPTSLVMLEPATPAWSPLISDLWESVVASASMSELATRLAAFGLDAMPSFAAFFWTDDSMRSMVRGAVTVVDLAGDTIVATGEGIQTWSEVGLSGVSRVRVDTPSGTGSAASALPLVVGAVRASSITLDATATARVTSPQAAALDAEPVAPAGSADPVDAANSAVPENAELENAEPEYGAEPDDLAEPGIEPDEPEYASEPDELEDADTEPQELEPDDRDGFGNDSLEYGDTQLMVAPPLPPTPPAPVPTGSQDSMIMAVVCQYGHASSQNATACRICGSPIAPQGPQLLPRPVLAVLRGSDGTTTAVDRAVLVGRAPSSDRSNARAPRLMTVPSPGHDISRSHAEVAPEGWEIVVTDLHSTNGTVVMAPGGMERWELSPGQPTPVPLGSVMELGDGVSVLIDFPQ